MPTYLVVASVTATAVVGEVEAENAKEAWDKGRELCESVKGKYVRADDIDEDRLYFDDLHEIEECKPDEYIAPKWRP